MQNHAPVAESVGDSDSSDASSTWDVPVPQPSTYILDEGSSHDASFPQFTKLSSEIRRRIWGYACPELQAPARILSFEVEEVDDANGLDFVLLDSGDLLFQTREVRKLLAVNRESRNLVKEMFPDTIDFKHCVPHNSHIIDGRTYFRKEKDIIWLILHPRFDQFHFPPNLNSFRLCDGVKEAIHVGLKLVDGRPTLFRPLTQAVAVHLLQQFPRLQYVYYGTVIEDYEEYHKEHYTYWCLSHPDRHEYGITYTPDANNAEGLPDVIWLWPKLESIHDGLIPRVISKSAKPIEATGRILGWQCIPLFEIEGTAYVDIIEDAMDPHLLSNLPDLPENSEVSDDEGVLSREADAFMDPHGAHHPMCDMAQKPPICGSRPNALPYELRDWGVQDREKGYVDSDAGDPEEDTSTKTFHKFNDLPTELRYRIWELFCPDLTAAARVYEFDISSPREPMTPQDFQVYDGSTTRSVTRKIRKVLAVNQESRNLALKALPDKLDFHMLPHEEIMLRGEVSEEPTAILRFRKETDLIHFKHPPVWVWEDMRGAYSLPGFADVVQNVAVLQPPNLFLREALLVDIKHLVEQFPNLVNYYYVVPPDLARPRYMTWSLAPEATRYQSTAVPPEGMEHIPVDKGLWCWVTEDAAPQLKIPRRVEDVASRLSVVKTGRNFNLLPATVFSGEGSYDTYGAIVEEEEETRVRAEKGEPEEPESEDEGDFDNQETHLEALLGAIMDGTMPVGIPEITDLLQQAGVDAHAAFAGANNAFHGGETDWEDEDYGSEDEEMFGSYPFDMDDA